MEWSLTFKADLLSDNGRWCIRRRNRWYWLYQLDLSGDRARWEKRASFSSLRLAKECARRYDRG